MTTRKRLADSVDAWPSATFTASGVGIFGIGPQAPASRFITLFDGVYDEPAVELTCASAGRTPPAASPRQRRCEHLTHTAGTRLADDLTILLIRRT